MFFTKLIIILLFLFSCCFQNILSQDKVQVVNNYESPINDYSSYLHGIDIIYWINLERSLERAKYMDKFLVNPVFNDIPKQRVVAVDVKNDLISTRLSVKTLKASDAEYAVLLSHLDTIRIFAQSDYEIALILEDDVTLEFQKYWKKPILQLMNGAPDSWEVLQLCYFIDKPIDFPRLEYEKHRYEYWSAAAYLINKKGANRISSIYNNKKYIISDNYEQQSDTFIFEYLVTFTYKFPYFIYRSDKNQSSTIQSSHQAHLNSRKDMLINYFELIKNHSLGHHG